MKKVIIFPLCMFLVFSFCLASCSPVENTSKKNTDNTYSDIFSFAQTQRTTRPKVQKARILPLLLTQLQQIITLQKLVITVLKILILQAKIQLIIQLIKTITKLTHLQNPLVQMKKPLRLKIQQKAPLIQQQKSHSKMTENIKPLIIAR